MSDLESQIEQEKSEIENAPKIPLSQFHPNKSERCSFCGQLTSNLVFVDRVHNQERYKGDCCGGTTNRV